MKNIGVPRTPVEKTLAAAAYAVYAERRNAGAAPDLAWSRVESITEAKISPAYLRDCNAEERVTSNA